MESDKKVYIYLMTLTIGGKVIAKYVGKKTYTCSNEGKCNFDVTYSGSGTCWKWLREEYGFTDDQNWEIDDGKKDSGYFDGKHHARFTVKVIHQVSKDELAEQFEQSIIKLMIASEGLNTYLIDKYRNERKAKYGEPTEEEYIRLNQRVDEFLAEYRGVRNGYGYFVNQLLSIKDDEKDNKIYDSI